jgi:GDP-4-dehydro-6-deoxy-D-mannose reductase
LITGAAGFAGTHLLDLLDAGADPTVPVVAWYRPGGAVLARRSAVTWEAVDILDRSSVVEAISRLRPAIVYHCAGAAHVGQAWAHTEATLAVNVRGTHHLLDGLSRAGGEARVLVPGSALVYRPASVPLTEEHPLAPAGPYGLSKLAQELLGNHTASGVQVMIARAFNHFGPGQDPGFSTSGFARQIAAIEAGLQPPEIAVGNLDARRDLTDVRDTVRAYRVIAERGAARRAYNVCSDREVAIGDVLALLVARARVPIRVQVDQARLRPHDVPLLVGDSTRLRTELGWKPAIPLEQTLDDILAYWRRQLR